MSTGDYIVDFDSANGEEYLKMHGYWVCPQMSQDCGGLNGDRSSSRGSEYAGSGVVSGVMRSASYGSAVGQARRGFPGVEAPLLLSQVPLVEDDDTDDTDEKEDAAGAIGSVDDDDTDTDRESNPAGIQYFLSAGSSTHIDITPRGERRSRSGSARAVGNGYRRDDTNHVTVPTVIETDEDEVPCLDEDVLGDLGDVIGYGGDRGSFVCRVPVPSMLRLWSDGYAMAQSQTFPSLPAAHLGSTKKAYKKYPKQISDDELAFVSTAYRCTRNSAHCQSRNSPFLTRDETVYAARHLVLPDAVVAAAGIRVGLLMPLYKCSLKELLHGRHRRQPSSPPRCSASATQLSLTASRTSSIFGDDVNAMGSISTPCDRGAFRTAASFRPVDSIVVVVSLAFQVLEAVAFLNHRLPHDEDSSGFTHNDLHLDNILVSDDGDVALCDFELVASTAHAPQGVEVRRLPPSSRQSPHGLFNETADTWAFGLMLVGLLTGVDPLFTSAIVNDFSDGPQLARWDRAACVLDWEANIKAHVEGLLLRRDPSGKRLEEARELLHVCGKCLVNRNGAEPRRAVDLLEEPIFRPYRRDFTLASRTVQDWLQQIP